MNKVRKIPLIASTVFFLFILSSNESVSGVRNNPNALRAVEEIDVVVQNLGSRPENSRFSHDQIRAEVEARLRLAGIKVSTEALPTLYVDIHSYEYAKFPGLVVFTIRLDLYQFVYLPAPNEVLWTSTWSTESVAVSGAANVSDTKDLMKGHLDKFINDYLSVNAKK